MESASGMHIISLQHFKDFSSEWVKWLTHTILLSLFSLESFQTHGPDIFGAIPFRCVQFFSFLINLCHWISETLEIFSVSPFSRNIERFFHAIRKLGHCRPVGYKWPILVSVCPTLTSICWGSFFNFVWTIAVNVYNVLRGRYPPLQRPVALIGLLMGWSTTEDSLNGLSTCAQAP